MTKRKRKEKKQASDGLHCSGTFEAHRHLTSTTYNKYESTSDSVRLPLTKTENKHIHGIECKVRHRTIHIYDVKDQHPYQIDTLIHTIFITHPRDKHYTKLMNISKYISATNTKGDIVANISHVTHNIL